MFYRMFESKTLKNGKEVDYICVCVFETWGRMCAYVNVFVHIDKGKLISGENCVYWFGLKDYCTTN